MVPEETQEATDCLPKAQSKSGVTQLDDPVTMASTNGQEENVSIGHTSVTVPEILTVSDEDVTSRVPEISQPCVSVAEAASTELPLNVEEALIREENNTTSHDADAFFDQEIPEDFAFPFPDPSSTLGIQGSASSEQGAQGTGSPPSSSAFSGGVQAPNMSDGESTSLPNNNPMGQNPQMHFPFFSDPYDYELEKLRREEENLKKSFEETRSELKAELERKMAEARSEFDRESKELDAAYNAKAMEENANKSFVAMSSLLANAFNSKCTDLAAVTARSFQHSSQQQQAIQANTHMNSTASPRPSVTAVEAPIPNPSGPLLRFPHYNTTQPRPVSQQAEQAALPRASVTAAEAPIPNLSGPPLQFPRSTMTQPRPISQQAEQAALPRPSVTAAEAPIPNLSGPPLQFPRSTMTQPRPIPQQAAVQTNTHMNTTAPPRPSVTAAEAPIPNPSGPLLHFPHCTTTQPRPISQQTVQTNTHMTTTAPPRPSVTAAEALIPISSGPLAHFPRSNTTQPRPISQEAAAQANTHMTSTALPRPSVTSEALSLHSLRSNTPNPRPPPLISNLTPSSYTPLSSQPVHGIMRAPAPHLQPFRSFRPLISSAAATTTNPRRLVQEQQQQQGNSNGDLVCLSDDDE